MKRIFACLLLILVSFGLTARSYKMIKGIVRDSSGQGIEAVSISAAGTRLNFASDSKGAFTAYIPDTVRVFEFSKKGWLTKVCEVAGYMSVRMSRDPAAVRAAEKRKAEEREQAVQKALRDSLAEAERIAMISREISDRVDDAMARRKDTVIVRQTVQTVVVRESPPEKVETRNKLSYKLDLTYTGQIADEDVVYENSGVQKIGNLSPLSLEFALYYNVGRYTSIGVGAGVSYALTGIGIPGDNVATRLYGSDFKEKRFDIPVYVDARFVFGKSEVRPAVSISGGLYALTLIPLGRVSVGCQLIRFKKIIPFIDLSLGTSPYPYFSETDISSGYRTAFAVSIKTGILL